jgi:hypothetical protein
MKYLFVCLFVLSISLVGCNKGPNTGFKCRDCDHGIAKSALSCPNCGSTREPVELEDDDNNGFIRERF